MACCQALPNRRVLVSRVGLIVFAALAICGSASAGTSNSLMDVSADGKLLACSNLDSGTVTIIDVARRTKTIHRAIQGLPPNQRLALILCHYEEMSYREASTVMQTSEKAIESLLVRARRNLRSRLAGLR